jgi:cytochrome c oxidase subunit 2
VDGLFYFTYAVCIFFFVLILGVLLFSVVKYRRKTADQPAASNVTHNTPLEVVWTVIPLIIVMVMFAWGFKGSLDMTTCRTRRAATPTRRWPSSGAGPSPTRTARQQSYGEVWVAGRTSRCSSSSSRPTCCTPSTCPMRVKRDVIPGRFQTVWFEPTEVGIYHLFCAEYCGNDHSKMYAKVHVVPSAEF